MLAGLDKRDLVCPTQRRLSAIPTSEREILTGDS
jgi:hypothetical protein